MVSAFDKRIVRVNIEFDDGVRTYDGMYITASGQKYLAAPMNTCEIKIANLAKGERNYILEKTSPLKIIRTPINVSLEVGRESYGTFKLFEGNSLSGSITQPSDIFVQLIALTNNFSTGVILSDNHASITQLSVIIKKVAENNGLKLNNQSTDKQIENFSYNGSASQQIQKLNSMGGIYAFVDNSELIVIDAGTPKKGDTRLLSAATGMVGIPQFTQKGIIVKMMIDNTVELGRKITVKSDIVPSADGDYIIQKMTYDVSSRDQQFFYTLDCISSNWYQGTL